VFVATFVAGGTEGCRNASARSDASPSKSRAVGTSGTRDRGDATDRDNGEPLTTGLFRSIAQRENPVVVAITTESRIAAAQTPEMFGDDDFLSRLFGYNRQPQPREQRREALGSGFLISADGEILTNNHVVAGADRIRVALYKQDRKTYEADVVGRDPLTDSALVKLKNGPGNLPVASLGDSDALQPGDWVMAIGNPFFLGHTVTVGVVSYKGRPFATTEGRFQNMLQTDASINPGNSGGPLINVNGDVIGINSAILSGEGGGGNIGIGFAVPINTVKALLPQLRKGSVQRGRLGVQVLSAPISDDEAKQLGLPKPAGAIISRVESGSPADAAGLRPGDVIVSYNGKPVQDADALTGMVADTPAGTKVPIAYYRNGAQQSATATIARLDLEDNDNAGNNDRGGAPGFGLSLEDLTPDIARQLEVPPGVGGALVDAVEPYTPASNAGLKRGDVILEVNRQPVHSAADASRALRSVRSGDAAFLLLWRGGARVFVEMRKE
jgi:serine protease Do